MNERAEHGLVLYEEITDPGTDEVIGYQWDCLQCESGSGASPSLEEAYWAGSSHRGTAHGAFQTKTKIEDRPLWDGDRITESMDQHIDRHPEVWVWFTLAVIAVVILLLVRAVWT